MALVAAAICPHPPLLVPEIGAGEQVAARGPALDAVRWLVGGEPDLVAVVGDAPATREYGAGDAGSFEGYGVDLRIGLAPGPGNGRPVLPLSLTVGAWLLGQTGWTGERRAYGISAAARPVQAAAVGARAAAGAGRVALLVMGDGSAARAAHAPRGLDPRARSFDATVAAALGAADLGALLALDPHLARDLVAAGRVPWQALAGAGGGRRWAGRVSYDDAPYGVGYIVATWEAVL